MENEVQPNIPLVQPLSPTPTPIPTSSNLLKILSFTVLGLTIVAGSVFAGIQIGKNQTSDQRSALVEPTATPTQVVVSPTTSVTDSTTNWETYTNELMKYDFTFPSDWKVEQVGADYGVNIALVDENDNKVLYVISTGNKDNLDLDNSYKANSCFENSCTPLLDTNEKIISKSIVKIGNQDMLTLDTQTQIETQKYYFIENENVIVMFQILTLEGKSLQRIDQILSTFKFIK